MADGYGIEDLWQAHNHRVTLWALCRRCGHARGVSPYVLIKKSRSSDQKLWEVSKRLKCGNCGQHQSVLIPGVADPSGRPKDQSRR